MFFFFFSQLVFHSRGILVWESVIGMEFLVQLNTRVKQEGHLSKKHKLLIWYLSEFLLAYFLLNSSRRASPLFLSSRTTIL